MACKAIPDQWTRMSPPRPAGLSTQVSGQLGSQGFPWALCSCGCRLVTWHRELNTGRADARCCEHADRLRAACSSPSDTDRDCPSGARWILGREEGLRGKDGRLPCSDAVRTLQRPAGLGHLLCHGPQGWAKDSGAAGPSGGPWRAAAREAAGPDKACTVGPWGLALAAWHRGQLQLCQLWTSRPHACSASGQSMWARRGGRGS